MKIHEYQGKEILRQFGVPTPRGMACFSVDEAVAAAQSLGGAVWVVKAQTRQRANSTLVTQMPPRRHR